METATSYSLWSAFDAGIVGRVRLAIPGRRGRVAGTIPTSGSSAAGLATGRTATRRRSRTRWRPHGPGNTLDHGGRITPGLGGIARAFHGQGGSSAPIGAGATRGGRASARARSGRPRGRGYGEPSYARRAPPVSWARRGVGLGRGDHVEDRGADRLDVEHRARGPAWRPARRRVARRRRSRTMRRRWRCTPGMCRSGRRGGRRGRRRAGSARAVASAARWSARPGRWRARSPCGASSGSPVIGRVLSRGRGGLGGPGRVAEHGDVAARLGSSSTYAPPHAQRCDRRALGGPVADGVQSAGRCGGSARCPLADGGRRSRGGLGLVPTESAMIAGAYPAGSVPADSRARASQTPEPTTGRGGRGPRRRRGSGRRSRRSARRRRGSRPRPGRGHQNGNSPSPGVVGGC